MGPPDPVTEGVGTPIIKKEKGPVSLRESGELSGPRKGDLQLEPLKLSPKNVPQFARVPQAFQMRSNTDGEEEYGFEKFQVHELRVNEAEFVICWPKGRSAPSR
jgi:hypothetical protein